jgi:WD40 repeat protein
MREGSVNLLYNHGYPPYEMFFNNSGAVLCLNYHENLVVSGSRDQTVRLFDLASKQLLQRYMADSYVYAVQLHDHSIVSSGNGFIQFRDNRTGLTADTLKIGDKTPLKSFKFKGNHVVFGTG